MRFLPKFITRSRGSGRGYAGFLSIIVDTLAAFVAWICCERLRVATCGLRENFRNSCRLSTGGTFMRDPGGQGVGRQGRRGARKLAWDYTTSTLLSASSHPTSEN